MGQKVEFSDRHCKFLIDSCKFLTVEIMGVQNFNFASKFAQNWCFFSPKFRILDKNF